MQPARPAPRRSFHLWGASHWLLAALAAPLFAAFAWQHGFASVGDDSVSYIVVARWLAGGAGPLVSPWVPLHTHFPPLFPLVLAATGTDDLLAAHLAVAAFAALSVGLLSRYAADRLGTSPAGVAVAIAFVLLPTAWIGAKGVLSETLFLAITLAALLLHDRCASRRETGLRSQLALGLLLAAAMLTRTLGVMLVAAYVARALVEWIAGRDRRPAAWLPLLPVAVLVGAWMAVRPGGQGYGFTLGGLVAAWTAEPAIASHAAWSALSSGWIASFMAQAEVGDLPRAVLYLLGAAALGGALRAAAHNRMDGWYVLFSLAVIFAWPFGESNTRRLLYPLVPLALVHVAEVSLLAAGWARLRRPMLAAAVVLAAPLLLALPPLVLLGQKAADRTPIVAGSRYAPADIIEYYTTINVAQAGAIAARHAAVLGGLEALAGDTPPQARIMWVRPEYVAVVGQRAGVPSYYEWDGPRLAREARDAGVDFIVVTTLYKSDLGRQKGSPAARLADIERFAARRRVLVNPVTREEEYLLLEVDRGALDAYLAGRV